MDAARTPCGVKAQSSRRSGEDRTSVLPQSVSGSCCLLSGFRGGTNEQARRALLSVHDQCPGVCPRARRPGHGYAGGSHRVPGQQLLSAGGSRHRVRAPARQGVPGGLRGFRCVRTTEHKLIESSTHERELYDLVAAPDELVNVADQHPQLGDDLARRLRQRFSWDPVSPGVR